MASSVRTSMTNLEVKKEKKMADSKKGKSKSIPPYEDEDEFDFVDAYSDETQEADEELLPENTASSAINCAFIGVGGGGGVEIGVVTERYARRHQGHPAHPHTGWEGAMRRSPWAWCYRDLTSAMIIVFFTR